MTRHSRVLAKSPQLLRIVLLTSLAWCGVAFDGGRVGAQAKKGQPPAATAEPRATYFERYRPQYHFTPAVNWMNDPNGLVYVDGEYHLFYQFNPFGARWGHMSWGHAVSDDLVHWRHLPVAIPELGHEMVFSGSAVVDSHNTSGFGSRGKAPLVAVYTAHDSARKSQAQALAYSNDRGRTWTRYAGNPVLDIGTADFRDPKVSWYAPGRQWVMVLALPLEHQVRFYSSPDLKRWTRLSEFGPAGAVGGIWECPDLFELPVEGKPGVTRWVLIASLNPGGVAGGSATQYFVGRFDGTRFVADPPSPTSPSAPASSPNDAAHWADFGKDFYAAVSYAGIPTTDRRHVWIGWMSNWQYANDIPTSPWRSAQSIPRVLTLRETPNGYRLVQHPVRELERLRGNARDIAPRDIAAGDTPLASAGISGRAMEIVADFDVTSAAEAGLKIRTGKNEETIVGIDVRRSTVFIDRTRSGDVRFHRDFTGRHDAPIAIVNGRVRLHLFIDWSSVELFADDGAVVITDQIFPSPESDGVALYARGGSARLVSGRAWSLSSAW